MPTLLIAKKDGKTYWALDAPTVEKGIENLIDTITGENRHAIDELIGSWDTNNLVIQIFNSDMASVIKTMDNREMRATLISGGPTRTLVER